MNNRQKWIAMGAGLGIGAVMMTVSGLSAMAGTSGYDAWKSAIKQTHTAASLTGQASVAVTDNDTQLFAANAVFKKGDNAASADVRLNAGGAAQEVNAYLQDGKAIWKTSDSNVYRVAEPGKNDGAPGPWRHADRSPNPAVAQGAEQVFDALVGNLKDRVTVQANGDGSKQVSLHLSGSQVPAAVNAIGSLIIGSASNGADHWRGGAGEQGSAEMHGLFAPEMKLNMPKLTQNIRIEAIRLDAAIDANNYVDRQSAEIQVVGQDASGAEHRVVIEAKLDLGDVNATSADSVDLTGKQVETVQLDERRGPHGWGRQHDGK